MSSRGPSGAANAERDSRPVEHDEVVAEPVVGDHRPVADPLDELPQRILKTRGVLEVAVLQSGQLRDALREPTLGPDQHLELAEHLVAGGGHGADLDDLMLGWVQPVGIGLQVEDHILRQSNHNR